MTNHSIPYTSQSVVGIIAPYQMLSPIKEALRGFPNIQASYFEDSFENFEALTTFIAQYEMIVVADPFIYKQLKQLDASLSLYQLNNRALSLYQLLLTHHLQNNAHPCYSFDLFQESDILAITHQLELELDYTFTTNSSIEQIVAHHIQLANEGYFVITTIAEVYEQLCAQNIRCEFLCPTKQELIVSFERILLASKSRQNKETQIVYGIIEFEMNIEQQPKVKQILQQFTQQLDGHLVPLSEQQYSFITTRGQFERETLGYKYLPLLSSFKEELHLNCVIGIGFGWRAFDSGHHAKQALYQAKENGPNVCYIVREDSRVIGPIDTTVFINYEQYPLAITDLQLLERAEKAGMSASYISKLMGRLTKHQKYIYTADELAQTLNITLRSANRILLKWLDGGLVEIVGEEKLAHRGRPKRIYYIKFLEEVIH